MSLFCLARTRSGSSCRRHALPGQRRCALHGGLSTGARTLAGKQRQVDGRQRHLRRLAEQGRKPGPPKGTGGRPRRPAARPPGLDELRAAWASKGRVDRNLDRMIDRMLTPPSPRPASPSASPSSSPSSPSLAASASPAQAIAAAASPVTSRADLPSRLEQTVGTAITQADHILALPFARDHAAYAAELRAKCSIINTALTTQARVDDLRLKREHDAGVLPRLLEEIRQAKLNNPKLFEPPTIPSRTREALADPAGLCAGAAERDALGPLPEFAEIAGDPATSKE